MSENPITATTAPVLHIESTPDTCGGKPRVAGTRIRVQDIVVWHERMGLSADEIVSRYPHLALADVYAALAYYHDHLHEIEADMATGQALVEEMRRLHPSKVGSNSAAE